MKKFISLFLAGALMFGLTACGNSSNNDNSTEPTVADTEKEVQDQTDSLNTTDNGDTITLRLAELHTAGYPTTMADEKFAELVKEATDGRINIEVYTDGQLGDETSVIEQVQYGGIDFTRVSSAPMAEFSKNLNALMMPYLYNDSDHMWKVLNSDLGQEMLESVSSAGFVGLAWYDGGSRNFYTNKEIHTLEDMKGLKLRVQDNQLMFGMVEALGAVPSAMPQGDIYSAIQSGVLDGAENNIPTYESYSQEEVAPYFRMDAHTRVPEILIGSSKSFEKLSEEDIAIIKDCAKQTQEFEIEQWKAREVSAREEVEKNNAKFIELEPAVIEQFREACQPLYSEFAADYSEIIDQIRAMAD